MVPGQTIYYQGNVSQNLDINCGFFGGQLIITTPDGVAHDVTPDGGIPLVCGSAGCSPAGVPFVLSKVIAYTVRAEDIGDNQAGFSACPGTNVQATIRYTGGTSLCDSGNTCDPSAQTSVCNPARVIGLVLEKTVACTTGTVCDASLSYSTTIPGAVTTTENPTFCYRFIVANTGTAALAFDSMTDDQLGDVSSLAPIGLTAGSVATNFISSPVEATATVTNTVILDGHTAVGCTPVDVAATNKAIANVYQSLISCVVSFERGGGAVTNGTEVGGGAIDIVVDVNNDAAGNNQALSGVQVIVRADGTFYTNNIVSIAAGAVGSTTFSGVIPDSAGIHDGRADITAAGAQSGDCPPISTVCSNSLELTAGGPCIDVEKVVKCLTASDAGVCSTDLGLYSGSASGAVNSAFCYAVTVSNCSNLPLTSLVVTDQVLSAALGVSAQLPGFPTELAVGASTTVFFGPVSYPDFQGQKVNTVNARASSTAGEVSDTAQAEVNLVAPSITCIVTANGQSGGTLNIPSGGATNICFAVEVSNNGDADLENVVVTNVLGACGNDVLVATISSLAAGASTNIDLCCTNVPCPLNGANLITLSNKVYVSGVVAGPCNRNMNDEEITVEHTCEIAVSISCVTPGCRTTGGGKQYTSEGQTCPNDALRGKQLRYVTHGGQVGAPYGASSAPELTDCATGAGNGFNNPCIRGEFQHVRHYQGGLKGVFHAASNGNQHDFDSLKCACLPCDSYTEFASAAGGCHPADRLYTADGIVEDGLCNPDDGPPHGVCGPEPRPAPDNKIAFSGIGAYAPTNGKKTKEVVFRVDIEDRSEPGGAHPKGGTPPPDRYRMRMWYIDGLTEAQVFQLREAVAVKDAHDERVGTAFGGTFQPGKLCTGSDVPAPDIDDGGDLDRGNRQIHPNTGATCTQ